jgi:hypothetical protein
MLLSPPHTRGPSPLLPALPHPATEVDESSSGLVTPDRSGSEKDVVTAQQLVSEVVELKGGLTALRSLLESADVVASDSSGASEQSLEWEPDVQSLPLPIEPSQADQPSLQLELLIAQDTADSSPQSSAEDSKGENEMIVNH